MLGALAFAPLVAARRQRGAPDAPDGRAPAAAAPRRRAASGPRGHRRRVPGASRFMWQALPAVAGWRTATESRAQDESFWYPVIAWLAEHPEPDHRVQVVATADNWEAYYLARRGRAAGARLVPPGRLPGQRGALRRPDAPARYDALAAPHGRALRVPARRPARLQRPQRGRAAALGQVGPATRWPSIGGWTVFELPDPTPIATPADGISVRLADLQRRDAAGGAAGHLPAAPALHALLERGAAARACATPREPWGTDLRVTSPGLVRLSFDVRLGHLRGRGAGQRGRLRVAGATAPRRRCPRPSPR